MATAKKLPSGMYRARAYVGMDENGKKIVKSFTARKKVDAELAANKYIKQHKTIVITGCTFSKAMDSFISLKEPVLSPSTIRGYTSIVRCLKKEYGEFCDYPVDLIDVDKVQKLIDKLTQKGLAHKTVKNYTSFIIKVLKCKNVYILGINLPEKVMPIYHIPDDESVKAALDASKGTELEIPIMLAAFGPLRRGEICALTLSDIKGNVIHVHLSVVVDKSQQSQIKAPKTTQSDRYIDMPQAVIMAIKKRGYVTTLNPNQITHLFSRLLKKNGISHFRFHDLRHYCVSALHAEGIPDAYIMQRGGWATDTVLKSVYRHTLQNRSKEMADKAISYFESVM